jgi:hypothetical protein
MVKNMSARVTGVGNAVGNMVWALDIAAIDDVKS